MVLPGISDRSHKYKLRQKAEFDQKHKVVDQLEPGSQVMQVDHTKATKWDARTEGPYTVVIKMQVGHIN